MQPGYDGHVVIDSSVRLSLHRVETRPLRCRPGTFEWRYGRDTLKGTDDGALYHAGNHYADLWERAGAASASSPDLTQSGGGQWKGLPDGRAVALQDIQDAFRVIGALSSARLTAYCVAGHTASDIAKQYGIGERAIAPVLHEDLRAAAFHFRFLGKG